MNIKKNNTKYIEFFIGILEKDRVIIDLDLINIEMKNCINIKKTIICILKPKKKKEIIELVKYCQKNDIKIYPFSTGNNWGYGSKNPIKDDSVIIDLSLMDKIISVNDQLNYATIQPGVTQGKLAKHLEENNYNLIINSTGAGPNCSIIGNALEKGFGIGLYNENFDALLDLEIILPNGDILKSGYQHFNNTKLDHIRPSGIGPDIKGLFAQSNLGIVVSATIKLQRKPKYKELLLINCESDDKIFKLIDILKELKNDGVLTNTIQLFNKNRVISSLGGKPNLNEKIMSGEYINKYTQKYNLKKWNGATIIHGTKSSIKSKKIDINNTLKKYGYTLEYYSEKKLKWLYKLSPLLSFIKGFNMSPLIKGLNETYDFYSGKPYNQGLNSCYYRNTKSPKNYNPAKENCGIYWISPIAPLLGKHEKEVYKIISEGFKKYEFDLFITINVINERQITNVVGLTYNKDDTSESQRAYTAHEEIVDNLISAGYLPYRLGIHDMEKLINKNDSYWLTISKIKKELDPNGILSPGRYCPDIKK